VTDDKTISSSEQYNELGNWVNFLKNNIAGNLNVAVLTFAQLNRDDNVADSDKIERYSTTGIRWRMKTADEVAQDGDECGNYAITVDFNRIGEEMPKYEYIDCLFLKEILTINECEKQHEVLEPEL
jgi:hypothetical protein